MATTYYKLTINTIPAGATVALSPTPTEQGYKAGTVVSYTVTEVGYSPVSGTITMDGNKLLRVPLKGFKGTCHFMGDRISRIYLGGSQISEVANGEEFIFGLKDSTVTPVVLKNLLSLSSDGNTLNLINNGDIYTDRKDYTQSPAVLTTGIETYTGGNFSVVSFMNTSSYVSGSKVFENEAISTAYEDKPLNITWTTANITTGREIFEDDVNLGIFTRKATGGNLLWHSSGAYWQTNSEERPTTNVFNLRVNGYTNSSSGTPTRAYRSDDIYIYPESFTFPQGQKKLENYEITSVIGTAHIYNKDLNLKLYDYFYLTGLEPNKKYMVSFGYHSYGEPTSLTFKAGNSLARAYLFNDSNKVVHTAVPTTFGGYTYVCAFDESYEFTADSSGRIFVGVALQGNFSTNKWNCYYPNNSYWGANIKGYGNLKPKLINETPWVGRYINIKAEHSVTKWGNNQEDIVAVSLQNGETPSESKSTYGYIRCDINKNIISDGIVRNERYGLED